MATRYIDYVGSWGPMILGHAHPEVLQRDARRAARRHQLRRADGARDRAGATARRRRCRRSSRCAWCQLGHRGDDDRDPPGARLHRPAEDRQVRRLLPRPRRRAAGARRLRRDDVRRARQRRRAGGDRQPDAGGALQRPRPRSRPASRAEGDAHRRGDRRAGGRQHGRGAAASRASCEGLRAAHRARTARC